MRHALEGVRVIDLSHVLAAPTATMFLADLGAEVIHVEPPSGDDAREFGPFVGKPGKIGGTDLLGLLSSIILCGHVTDVSPLSTLGAIFIANATEDQDRKKLFRNMLIGGLAMTPVGAVVCWFLFTVLGIP